MSNLATAGEWGTYGSKCPATARSSQGTVHYSIVLYRFVWKTRCVVWAKQTGRVRPGLASLAGLDLPSSFPFYFDFCSACLAPVQPGERGATDPPSQTSQPNTSEKQTAQKAASNNRSARLQPDRHPQPASQASQPSQPAKPAQIHRHSNSQARAPWLSKP